MLPSFELFMILCVENLNFCQDLVSIYLQIIK